MGWTFMMGASRKDAIEELTGGHEKFFEKTGETRGVRYLARQYKGCAFSGVLYAVGQPYVKVVENDAILGPIVVRKENREDRFILVALMKCETYNGVRSWGYKDMEESMHPYNYSCPLKYLKMAPKVACAEWRGLVREWHERSRARRAARREARRGLVTASKA